MRTDKIAICISFAFLMLGLVTNANYRFAHLTIKEGLSQSTVKAIYQDWRGFMWFGTSDGLNRFDGYNFTHYRNEPDNPHSISGNDISFIYENPYDSTLWIGTQNDGFSKYCRSLDAFTAFRRNNTGQNGLPSDNISTMAATGPGELWIGTQGGGLTRFSMADSSFSTPEFSGQVEFRHINTLLAGLDGSLWIGTPYGLYKYLVSPDGNINESLPVNISLAIKGNSNIMSLAEDARGNIWIGTYDAGLIRYHQQSLNTSQYLHDPADYNSISSNTVRSVLLRKNGTIWLATPDGLCSFNQRENTFITFRNDPSDTESITDDEIFSLWNDRSDVLWVGTYFGGVNRMDPKESRIARYTNFHKLFNLSKAANHTRSIYVDESGRVWVATSKGVMVIPDQYIRNPSGKTPMELFFRESDNYFVFGDTNGNIYVSNNQGLFIKKSAETRFHLLAPIDTDLNQATNFVFHALEDSDRMVWFFTLAGLVKYNPKNNTAEIFNPKDSLGVTIPSIFISGFESYNGKIWCGMNDGTIYRFDRYIYQFEMIVPEAVNNENKPYNRIFSICETGPGSIWYGTNNGLYHYNEPSGELHRYLSMDGLANNVVYAVLADSKNRVWCSTNLGISVFDPENKSFVNYTWEDGLQSNEFNQSAYFKSADGNLYFGGINGINIINPANVNPNPFVPPVVITGLSVDHVKVNPWSHPQIIQQQITEARQVTLKHHQAIFTFEFAALNYIHPGKNQYRYKLEGYDKDWISEDNSRTASYANIPPGKYTFMVQGSNNSGIWNDMPASVKVIISPPFWLTWWFKTAFILAMIFVVYLIISFRMRGVKNKNEWLQSQVQEKMIALSEKNSQIEQQNLELKRINDEISERNKKIEEKNNKLNLQNEQIVKQRDDLFDLSQKLEESNQSRTSFFTNIHHEFITPLSLIIGPVKELLEIDKNSKTDLTKKFNIIYANASKLLILLNQLLDFRKTEISQPKLELSRTDIVRLIRDINYLFNDLAARKNISFVFTSAFPVLEICFDTEKIEKVVTNLIANAFKFTNSGGRITVELSTTPGREGSHNIELKVTDNGYGIPEENLSLIFERFYNYSPPGIVAGSGIGLALVKRYTELHGGNVSVVSSLGTGSSFTISFPMVDDCLPVENESPRHLYTYSETVSSSLTTTMPGAARDIKNGEELTSAKLVVIVDDNDFRDYLVDILSGRYRIYTAGTFTEGFDLISSKNPDLIICEVNLSDATGYDLCRKVKGNYPTSHIPVVLLSSHSDIRDQITGIQSGCDAYITKPFDNEFLIVTAENLVEQRKKIKSKYFFGPDTEIKDNALSSEENQFIAKVLQEIENNLQDSEFDVERLCRNIGLSQPQTYRKIKSITDLSIAEFIRNTRLKKAARLMSGGNLTVSEVAYEVGFNDPNYFTKCFTRLFGQTPTDYLKLRNNM
ncbi:MAG: two-component regulator propeller domain-containing protein [Bacteroidota bacterium]